MCKFIDLGLKTPVYILYQAWNYSCHHVAHNEIQDTQTSTYIISQTIDHREAQTVTPIINPNKNTEAERADRP